jgi:hypothetical protein
MALDREERKRVLAVIMAAMAGLVVPFMAIWPNIHEFVIVGSVTVILFIAAAVPVFLIGLAQSRVSTIYKSVHLLLRNRPCNRTALKHACESFAHDPNIKALGMVPIDAPVPIDLLRRIEMSPRPQAALRATSQQKRLFRYLVWITAAAAIARIIFSMIKK